MPFPAPSTPGSDPRALPAGGKVPPGGRPPPRPPPPRPDAPLPLERPEVRRRLLLQLDADHQPEAADLADQRRVDAPEALDPFPAQRVRALPQPLPHDDVEGGPPRRARERVPAERGVVAPLKRPLDRLRG